MVRRWLTGDNLGTYSIVQRPLYNLSEDVPHLTRVKRKSPLFLGGFINATVSDSLWLGERGRANYGPLASGRFRR